MGCIQSIFLAVGKYDDQGVTGCSGNSGLEIIKMGGEYVQGDPTILKLKEKYSVTGEDYIIEGLNGRLWFKIKGDSLSTKDKSRDLIGYEGSAVAGYQCLTTQGIAYITKEVNRKTLVHATIKKSEKISRSRGIDIFIHDPLPDIEDVSTDGLHPRILMKGDFSGKNYGFLIGNDSFGYSKIAEVLPTWETSSEKDSYFVNIGSNVDILFISMCAKVVDEMFCD